MDWGLAKVIPPQDRIQTPALMEPAASAIRTVRSEADGIESQPGQAMGTPAYMAPEQARGEVEHIDARSDVFGLGAILCEILTGQPPYSGRSAQEIHARAICADLDDALTRLAACGAEADLTQLTRACLREQWQDRPRDAGAVAAAMTAYQHSVQARLQQAEVERAAEAARAEEAQATAEAAQARVRAERRARRLTLTLASSLLLAGALGTAGWRWVEADRQARAAQRDGRVNAALQEALRRRGLAQGAAGSDLGPWTEAVAAARQAQALLEAEVNPSLGQQVETLLAEVSQQAQQAEIDHHLLDRFVDIRSARAEDPDGSATDAAYAEAFAAGSLDVAGDSPAEVAARLRARRPGVAVAMVAALDEWAAVRRLRKDLAGAARLITVAQGVDSDAWRRDLRAAVAQPDPAKRRTELQKLAREARFDALSAISLDLLGMALNDSGEVAEATTVLRAAQRWHPGDVWVNYDLARILEAQGRREEALHYYIAARALRPETAHELAHALEATGEPDQAIAVFQDLVRLRPKDGRHLGCLGKALHTRGRSQEAERALDAAVATLQEQIRLKPDAPWLRNHFGNALFAKGQVDEALAEYRQAIKLDPKDGRVHYNVGNALAAKGQVEEAIAEYRQAIKLDPKGAQAHCNLGSALYDKGQVDDAIAEYQQAIVLDPKLAMAHNNLGLALKGKGQVDKAIAAYQQAIQLNPTLALAYYNLGIALEEKGPLDEAIAAYRQATTLDPKLAGAHYNLGNALKAKGHLDEAIGHYRQAITLDPKDAEAHCNLGLSLQQLGRFGEALAVLKRGHELGSNTARYPRWCYPSDGWVQQAQLLAALERKLPAVLKGEAEPADSERLGLAVICQAKHLNRAAARFYTAAFAAQPRRADDLKAGHRYNAACVAALAAAGAGADAAPLGDKEQTALCRQALDWLRADLKAWAQATDRALVEGKLQHWQQDTNLASVRDKETLAKLPPAERDAWQKLWSDVAGLLTKGGK
jgi:tetratricopeptide (TPR) repeat protein